MKHVVHRSDGSIVAVHHSHSGNPTAEDAEILEVADDDWPDGFEIGAYEVQNGSLVKK